MKKIKILGIAIVALAMCILFGVMAFAADSEVVTYSATLDKDEVCGEEAETVTMTVGFDKTELTVTSIQFNVEVPTGWEIVSVTNENVTFNAGVGDALGLYSWLDLVNAETAKIGYVAKITVKVPENTAAGDYTITMHSMEMVDEAWEKINAVPETVTATVKVGHDYVDHAAQAPTCTEIGWDAYQTCGREGCTYSTYEEIAALGHTDGEAVKEKEVAPACTENGSYDSVVYCTVCDTELSRENVSVAALGHNEVNHEAKAATCTAIGWDAYVTCSRCDYTTYEEIAALGHDEIKHDAKAATCTAIGWDAYVTCSRCSYTTYVEIPATGHTEVTDAAKAPTCTEPGLTEGKRCSVCGTITVEQTKVAATGHSYNGEVTTKPTCEATGVMTYKCSVCGDTYTENIAKDSANHTGTAVTYKNDGNTHSATYNCCGAVYVTGEAHAHDETTGLCICGDAKEFTLTIYGMDGTTVIYTAEIPCGTKFFDTNLKNKVNEYYGKTLFATKMLASEDSSVDYWDNADATMPVGDLQLQAYWSGSITSEDGTQFVEDNNVKKDWFVQDGSYYYADPTTGYCATGLVKVPYPGTIGDFTYAPNAEDVAYAESKDVEFIDAKTVWLVFDENGQFCSNLTAIQDGKYVENGMIAWHPGLVEYNGGLYYFVGDAENGGNKLADGNVWVTRTNGVEDLKNGACYNFKNGQLSGLTGIVGNSYFENSEKMYGAGLVKLGENYIYVRSSGVVVMNDYYYIPANDLGLVSEEYYFDENGYMVDPNTNLYNGVVDGYYYVNGKVVYGAGLIELDGDIYYVRSNGQVATGKYYVTNVNDLEGYTSGQKLYFGEDGKLIRDTGVVDGYYYVDGELACGAGIVELIDENGDVYYIYVRSNGQLATGKYWPTNLNGYLSRGEYDWGTDGKYYPDK